MNAQNTEQRPVITRESKNRIRVDFDRTPLKDRLKARFLNFYFITKIVYWIFRMVLMIGVSYIVLYPFLTKIAGSVMAVDDFLDVTVRLIPKHFTLDIYRAISSELGYWTAFRNTMILSLITAVLQTAVCALIGYGFAKFKFKGRSLMFLLVVLTMIVPHQTLRVSMFMEFRYFDVLGIVRLLKGGGIQIFGLEIKPAFLEKLNILPDKIQWFPYTVVKQNGSAVTRYWMDMGIDQNGINTTNTYIPMVLLSLGGLGFKNGLYIFLFRQFFRGLPDELEESAYIDGSGTFNTFVKIILPLSVPMLITVFLFSFCWQWTDSFYTDLFFTSSSSATKLLSQLWKDIPPSLELASSHPAKDLYSSAIHNTCGLMIIFPLVILYIFFQKFLVQGIEQSGLAN